MLRQGCSKTFQNAGVEWGAQVGCPGLKMAALHRSLYKVSFHGGGGSRRAGLLTGGLKSPIKVRDSGMFDQCSTT